MIAKIEKEYLKFKEQTLTHRRFTHADLLALLNAFKADFNIQLLGRSLENRELFHIRIGEGKTKILLWSQMHGNESTATAALMDLLNFFAAKEFSDFKEEILSKLTIHIVPMLNPDGAERFQRRNAVNIDLNRDAMAQSMPETRALFHLKKEIQADIAFNLHDQRSIYNVSGTGNTSTISLLAPEMDARASIPKNRAYAMNLIASINDFLQDRIPNHISRYDDVFSPRCVGDQFQKAGIATILVESGSYKNDSERQKTRELNFLLLLEAFSLIAKSGHKKNRQEDYFKIPLNDKKLFDLLVRDLCFTYEGNEYQIDVGFRNEEYTDFKNRSFWIESMVEDLGDLSTHWGIEEFSAKGYQVEIGRNKICDACNLSLEEEENWLRSGITALTNKKLSQESLRLLRYGDQKLEYKLEENAAFDFLLKKNNSIEKALVNGQMIDLL